MSDDLAPIEGDVIQIREWPNGRPGNRRKGHVRGKRAGTRRGTLPARSDPVILKRRELAAPLWISGYSARQIQERINVWLESEGQDHVSLETIYKDHRAIVLTWQHDFDYASEEARVKHLASLNRLGADLWARYIKAEGKEKTALADRILKLIETQARVDGTLSKHSIDVRQVQSFEQTVLDIIGEVDPDVRLRIEEAIQRHATAS